LGSKKCIKTKYKNSYKPKPKKTRSSEINPERRVENLIVIIVQFVIRALAKQKGGRPSHPTQSCRTIQTHRTENSAELIAEESLMSECLCSLSFFKNPSLKSPRKSQMQDQKMPPR